jgi:hypothetical protein
MSQATTPATSEQVAPGPAAPPPAPPAPAPAAPVRQAKPLTFTKAVKHILGPVASLRVTVVLFALSVFLVFAGTLAQAESGIWTVVNQYFRSALVWIPFQVFVKFGQVFLGVDAEAKVAGSFPFPGGWLLGGLLLANLLAAHLLRFRVSWKRSGILLIHSGLVVMMLSELITGLYAVEGNMAIGEGESTNYVDNNREFELAVIDRSGPEKDDVFAIPVSFLTRGKDSPIRHDALPFEIVVEKYMANSWPVKAPKGDSNLATKGDGLHYGMLPRSEVPGASTDEGSDVPAAYLTFKKKGTGESLGTYLVSGWFYSNLSQRRYPDLPQHVRVDGKDYDIWLRPHRTYRPFAVRLLQFQHDKFVGTNTPKNFSSDVRVVEPTDNGEREVFEVKIWMNHPLRYSGETFYQQGYFPNNKGTVLQVVRNPGWLMPYISCAMVAIGMLFHFGLHLFGFLRRRATA